MSSSSQLFLLADHIKLSILERKRAQSLDLEDDSQDGHISRSFDQFRDGLAVVGEEQLRLAQAGDEAAAASAAEDLAALQKQYDDLTAQFHGFADAGASATLTHPNSDALADDFAHATSGARKPKSVRFSDSPPSPQPDDGDDPSREDLFGGRYRDDPTSTDAYRDDAAQLDNQQLHEYHSQILEQQDEQLDRLGESIGRQRELSMQIGDELDSHVAMLDDVEGLTDRHQSRLDRASRVLGRVARGAGENKQMTAIVVLIIILILLIAILK